MATTVIAAGERFDCSGTYEDIKATFAPKKLAADNGLRELVTTDGDPVTINVAAVALIRSETAPAPRRKVGFV